MSNFRFGLMVALAFALTFLGVILGKQNMPMMAMRAAPPSDTVASAVDDDVKPDTGKATTDPKPAQATTVTTSRLRQAFQRLDYTGWGDHDRGRSQMRLTVIEAANNYALAPCDRAIKAAFVVATTTYVQAITAKPDGKSAAMGSAMMDERVREALQKAFAVGGVGADDFPASAKDWVASIATSPGDNNPNCPIGQTAEHLPS